MKKADWAAIKSPYQAGVKSVRELARDFNVSEAAIRQHATKEGWKRKQVAPATKKVRTVTAKQDAKCEVRSQEVRSAGEDLTLKMEAFCQAYMANGGNATQAYRSSYDTRAEPEICSTRAKELMADSRITVRIGALREAAAVVAIVEEADVLREMARIALSDIGELFDLDGNAIPIHKLPRHVRAAIASVKISRSSSEDGESATIVSEIKYWDKNSAAEKLMKHLGSFEKDNKQRAGIFDKLPATEVKRIKDRLIALRESTGRPVMAGQPVAGNASRAAH